MNLGLDDAFDDFRCFVAEAIDYIRWKIHAYLTKKKGTENE